ncbi:MAG: HEPN domain-containing protein [Anaerolineae bacterium]
MAVETRLSPVIINGVVFEPKSRLHRLKLEALMVFLEELLRSPVRSEIAKVILFGSALEGDVGEESDIDLLVFGIRDRQAIRNMCAEAAFQTGLRTGESVQPLVYPLSRYYHPASFFMHRSARRGKEVYSMEEKALKMALLEGKYGLASSYLRVARYVLANGDYREAADLAYNAAEALVKGLLLIEMDALPKTHGGLVNRFGDLYARTGKVPAEWGRDLHLALETRSRARYEEEATIAREDALAIIALAEKLIEYTARVREELQREGDDFPTRPEHGGSE